MKQAPTVAQKVVDLFPSFNNKAWFIQQDRDRQIHMNL